MVVVTPTSIYKARSKDKVAVKNAVPGELSHTTWYPASILGQYNNVLIWHEIYWINIFVDVNNPSERIYLHYILQPEGILKVQQYPDPSPTHAFDIRIQQASLGNIFNDKTLMNNTFIPTDSYKWLFTSEFSDITSERNGKNPAGDATNMATYETIILENAPNSYNDATNWKPPKPIDSTGPPPPSDLNDPPQSDTCKLYTSIFTERRQDPSRSRYVKPDLTVNYYERVINALNYTPDIVMYYKLSEVYEGLQIYNYIYYVKDIFPTDTGLNKEYVRIDPYGNSVVVKSDKVFNPQTYPNIPFGNKIFNIFSLQANSQWSFDNLYIPITFYGTIYTEDYDYFIKSGCSQTFKNITYEDISKINDYKPLNNNQFNEPPPKTTDPDSDMPPVDTTDPDVIPPVDMKDPNDGGLDTDNDPENPDVITDDGTNTPDPDTTTVTTIDNGEATTKTIIIENLNLGYSKNGKGGFASSPQPIVPKINKILSSEKGFTSIQYILGLLTTGVIIYAIVEESKRN